jgi:putative peptide zinc metalloprotease protein
MTATHSACVKLRHDLQVTSSEDGSFVIEDPQRSQFFRLGAAEYSVVAQLDGQTDLREAVRRTVQIPGTKWVTAESLYPWLVASGLLVTPANDYQPANAATRPSRSRFNPCYFRIPLGAPTRLLTSLERGLGWLCSRSAICIVSLFSILAVVAVVSRWELLTSSLGHVLCPDQHLALLGCWLLLKLVHELGHGIACHRLGGEVREWGLAFIYGMPVPYTDVTSSWRFSSRLDRMAVAAAGMYFEWLIALFAVAVACFTTSPILRQLGMYCLSLATVTTILFNANPLCRLDGYYILTDLLGWPNLAADGQRALSTLNRLPRGRNGIAFAYGLAAFFWRILALLTMAVVVLLAYEGLGLLLIAVVAITWYWPNDQLPSSTSAPTKSIVTRVQTYGSLLVMGCLLAALACTIPWPIPITAPGIVESQQRHIVRVPSAGHVVRLLVEDGQWVRAGQELALLDNAELTFELSKLESLYAQGEARLRLLHTKRQLVDLQVEQQRQETIAARIVEQRRKIEELTLRAPAPGRVTARRIADLPGSYLAEGAELCSIVEPGAEFQVSIAERDLPHFQMQLGKPINIRLPSGTIAAGTLTRLEPHASTQLPDPALGAQTGGPLPVTPGAPNGEANQPLSDWKLLEPRITGTITLFATDDELIFAGQRGSAALPTSGRTIKAVIQSWCEHWIRGLQQRAG